MAIPLAFAESTQSFGASAPDPADYDDGPDDKGSYEPQVDKSAAVDPHAEVTESNEPEPEADSTPEPEQASAPAAEAEPESAPESVDFDADILKEAVESYGWSEDEVKSFGSRDKLQHAMRLIDREFSNIGRQLRTPQQNAPNQQTPSQESAAPQSSTSAAAPALSKYELKLDPDSFDPDTLKAFQDMNEHYNSTVEKLHNELLRERERTAAMDQQFGAITSQQQQAEAARIEQEMEAFFNGLGDEWKDTFGKGDYRELISVNPTVVQNRAKLFEEMENIRIGQEARGRSVSSRDELRQRALRSAFGDNLKTIARKELTSKVQERQSQQIARPSGRNKAPASSKDKALAFIAEQMKGMTGDDSDYADEGL